MNDIAMTPASAWGSHENGVTTTSSMVHPSTLAKMWSDEQKLPSHSSLKRHSLGVLIRGSPLRSFLIVVLGTSSWCETLARSCSSSVVGSLEYAVNTLGVPLIVGALPR